MRVPLGRWPEPGWEHGVLARRRCSGPEEIAYYMFYEVRLWIGWYTLAMLALAYLAVLRARLGDDASKGGPD